MEVGTNKQSQPVSFEAGCKERKVSLGINSEFAKLFAGELVADFGAYLLKKHGSAEEAQKTRERILERREKHEFGDAMNNIENILGDLAAGCRAYSESHEKAGKNE